MNRFGRIYQDRTDAGRQLAKQLFPFAAEFPVILAIPRGGVPIGYEIAAMLHAPLDVIAVRKIGLPTRPEFGVGAVAEEHVQLFDDTSMRKFGITEKDLGDLIEQETAELQRRVKVYRGTTRSPNVKNRTVLLADDGLATGVTALAAIQAVKKMGAKKIIFASPVCAIDSAEPLRNLISDVICISSPVEFTAVGMWYREFNQTSDSDVIRLLKKNKQEQLGKKPDQLLYKEQ